MDLEDLLNRDDIPDDVKDSIREESRRQEYIEAILNNAPDAVVTLDSSHRIVEWNPAAEQIFGYSQEEVQGHDLDEIISRPDVVKESKNYTSNILSGKPVDSTESVRYTKDNVPVQVQISGSPIICEGKLIGGVAIYTDITERKQVEEKLNKRSDAMESSMDGIAILDENEKYFYINDAHARIYGYDSHEELLGKSWKVLYDKKELERFENEIMPQFIDEGRWKGEAVGKKKDGTKFSQEVSLTALEDGGLICVVRDITEQKQAEEALRESEMKFRNLSESTDTGIMLYQNDYWIYANPAAEKITGYAFDKLQHMKFWEFTAPEYVDLIIERGRARQKGEPATSGYEFKIVTKQGEEKWVLLSGNTTELKSGKAGLITLMDTTEQKQAQERLEELVMEDPMTGLYNRRAFQDDITKKIARSERDESKFSLLTIDIDNFKRFNDEYGHSAGDGVLIEAAKRVQDSVRGSDTVYRIGGDEFAILLDPVSEETDAGNISDRIIKRNSMPYNIQDKELDVTLSIGVANYPALSTDKDELINGSDMAAKYAKRNKTRSNYVYFNTRLNEEKRKEKDITRTIDRALEEGHFLLKYQPIFSRNGQIERLEALARIALPEGDIISPGDFIPLAEKTGQIKDIDSYILQKACADMNDIASYIYDTYGTDYRLGVSVNISSNDIADKYFLQRNEGALDKATHPKGLCLEITEQSIIDNPENVMKNMEALREKGVRFGIDDFGKKYSSISRLIDLPADELKIDKAYIDNVCYDEKHLGVVEFITSLASKLGMESTAEGVETREQYDVVCSVGCNNLQGFYPEKLSPPLVFSELKDFVTRRGPSSSY